MDKNGPTLSISFTANSTARSAPRGEVMGRSCCCIAILFFFFALAAGSARLAEAKSYFAYISDSPASSSVYWVAQDAGIF